MINMNILGLIINKITFNDWYQNIRKLNRQYINLYKPKIDTNGNFYYLQGNKIYNYRFLDEEQQHPLNICKVIYNKNGCPKGFIPKGYIS